MFPSVYLNHTREKECFYKHPSILVANSTITIERQRKKLFDPLTLAPPKMIVRRLKKTWTMANTKMKI